MILRASFLGTAALAVSPALAPAQIRALATTGDTLPGGGAISYIDGLHVNDVGEWLIVADIHPAEQFGEVLLREGPVVVAQQGDPVSAPVGAKIWAFGGISLNANGDFSSYLLLTDPEGWHEDSGLYCNDVLVVHEGATSTSPVFTPGTKYRQFTATHLDASNRITLVAYVDDPALPTDLDHALVVFEVAPDGSLVSETVIAKEGDILPGQTQAIATLGSNPHSLAVNEAGSVMYVVDLAGDPNADGAVYVDDVLVAQEGRPSPIPGRNWRTLLDQTVVDLNESGDWVLCGKLDGDTLTDQVIVSSHGVVAQEGHPLTAPGFEDYVYTMVGKSRVCLTDDGRVLYRAQWSDPDASKNEGLFLDGDLLVQKGVTAIGGDVVAKFSEWWHPFAISGDGTHLAFEATLEDGTEGVFMLDIPGPTAKAVAYAGCSPTGAWLRAPTGPPTLGGTLKLQTKTTTFASALPFLAFALAPLDIGGGCGLPLPGISGELLIDATVPFVGSTFLAPFIGAPVPFALPVANDPALMGLELHAQVLMIDALLSSAAPFEFSNGMYLRFGI